MFQYILFAITKVYVLLCRIPSAIHSYVTDWVTRTAREQCGVAGREGQSWIF